MNADKRGSGKSGGSGKLDIGKAKAHRGDAETRRKPGKEKKLCRRWTQIRKGRGKKPLKHGGREEAEETRASGHRKIGESEEQMSGKKERWS